MAVLQLAPTAFTIKKIQLPSHDHPADDMVGLQQWFDLSCGHHRTMLALRS
jgi:hypothetical protein